jgi:hypothetical protein
MSYQFYDFVGNLGVLFIVGSYGLVQLRRMSATGLVYTLLNIFGAMFILYSLLYDFNLSAVIVEVFWLLASLMGLVRIYRERRAQAA